MGPYQVVPLLARMDLGTMAMKGYFAFPKSSGLLELQLTDCLVSYQEIHWGSITDPQSVYNIAPATGQCISIIIIMSCRHHRYPWPSLATSPYRSSPLAGLQGYIPYPHIAAICMFELVVLLLLGHMWGSIGVHHLWARPCFSSSV